MRKNKYTIEVDIIDTLGTGTIEISERAYKEQIEKLSRQCHASLINDYECEGTHTETVKETEAYKSITHRFRCGCSTIYLTADMCKTGYHFA